MTFGTCGVKCALLTEPREKTLSPQAKPKMSDTTMAARIKGPIENIAPRYPCCAFLREPSVWTSLEAPVQATVKQGGRNDRQRRHHQKGWYPQCDRRGGLGKIQHSGNDEGSRDDKRDRRRFEPAVHFGPTAPEETVSDAREQRPGNHEELHGGATLHIGCPGQADNANEDHRTGNPARQLVHEVRLALNERRAREQGPRVGEKREDDDKRLATRSSALSRKQDCASEREHAARPEECHSQIAGACSPEHAAQPHQRFTHAQTLSLRKSPHPKERLYAIWRFSTKQFYLQRDAEVIKN